MRKFKVVTIAAKGRDEGKSFLIVEKSAYDAEKWATRALLALSQVGAEVGDDALSSGALGILVAGLEAFKVLPYDLADPLLEEMMTCISFVPDPGKINADTGRPLSRGLRTDDDEGDIQEVATLLKLRSEVLDLHLGFSVTAALSSLAAAAGNRSSQQTTSTSPEPAASPSAQAAPA